MEKYHYKLHEIGELLSEGQIDFLVACAVAEEEEIKRNSPSPPKSIGRGGKRGRRR